MTTWSLEQREAAAGLFRLLSKLPPGSPRRVQLLESLRARNSMFYGWVTDELAKPLGEERFARYPLSDRPHRSGAEANVWKSYHPEMGLVAVKVYKSPRPILAEQLTVACEAHRKVCNASVSVLLDFGFNPSSGHFYIVTKWVGDDTLEDKLRAAPALAVTDIARWVEQLAGGLEAAHAAGVVHADIKPGNVAFSSSGVPTIIDWDAALPLNNGRGVQVRWNTGTDGFAAPEQTAGRRIDQRTDVYGLAATLYALLADGSPPVPPQVNWRQRAPTVRPDWEKMASGYDALRLVAWRGLRKAMCNRYPSAVEMRDDLRLAADGKPVRTSAYLGLGWPAEQPFLRPRATRTVKRASIGGAIIVSLVMGIWLVTHAAAANARERQHAADVRRMDDLLKRGDYSEEAVALADSLSAESPSNPAARVRPFALRLMRARTQADRTAALEWVRKSAEKEPFASSDVYVEQAVRYAHLHRLVAWTIGKSDGLVGEPDERELYEAVRDIERTNQGNPAVGETLTGNCLFHLLLTAARTFDEDTFYHRRETKRWYLPPPKPFQNILGGHVDYWRAETIASDPTNLESAELCYHLAAASLSRAEYLFRFVDLSPRGDPNNATLLRAELDRAVSCARRARTAVRVTPAEPLFLKAWAVEAAATITLLRTTPELTLDEIKDIGGGLKTAFQVQLDGSSEVQLFLRVALAAMLVAERETSAVDRWAGRDADWNARAEQLKDIGRELLRNWVDAEVRWREAEPNPNWNKDTKEKLQSVLSFARQSSLADKIEREELTPHEASTFLREAAERNLR